MTTSMTTSPAGKKTNGATEKGREREETDPGRESVVVVDLETGITGDPRMIAGEADPKNGNPRSKKNERERGSMRGMRGLARNSRTLINQLRNHRRNHEGSVMKIRYEREYLIVLFYPHLLQAMIKALMRKEEDKEKQTADKKLAGMMKASDDHDG